MWIKVISAWHKREGVSFGSNLCDVIYAGPLIQVSLPGVIGGVSVTGTMPDC